MGPIRVNIAPFRRGIVSTTATSASPDEAAVPIIIKHHQDLKWQEETDVAIIGLGGAGAVAALQARANGASVLAIDRFDGGGATAYSGGIIYAGNTRYQKEDGYFDKPEEMFKYLKMEDSPVKDRTLLRFCRQSSGNLEWLAKFGINFGSNVYEPKTNFPPGDHYIYYSGNEKMPEYAAHAKPAPRGHRVNIRGFGGKFYFQKLKDAVLQSSVKCMFHSRVTRLVTSPEGVVLGVEVRPLPKHMWATHQKQYKIVHPWRPLNHNRSQNAIKRAQELEESMEKPIYIRAKKAVIITTGGFNRNTDMFRMHASPSLHQNYASLLPLGSISDDGAGLKLGTSAGGTTGLMQNITVARTLVPPDIFAEGIMVNKDGKRFYNEAAYAMFVGTEIAKQKNGEAWLLIEARKFWRGIYQCFFSRGTFLIYGAPALINICFGGTRKAATLEKLAAKIMVDPRGLLADVAQWNAIAENKSPDKHGKLQELIKPLHRGPFYALNMSLSNKYAPAQCITMGGLRVDEETGGVLRADGSVITGLYAAGRAAVGVCSGGFVSGMALADTVFSGRRAAIAATSPDHKDTD